MAEKVLLKDKKNNVILPITRGELILDSSGEMALHSEQFLASTSKPGLMSSSDKANLDRIAEETVDDELDINSSNPVQNKVITQIINSIREKYLKSVSVENNKLTITDQSDKSVDFFGSIYSIVTNTTDGLVPKFDSFDGTIDDQSKDWILTNHNGNLGWYKLPTSTFTQNITSLYIGDASSKGNTSTTNGSTYFKLFENSELKHKYKIQGAGSTTVSSDSDGNLTISSPILSWNNISNKPNFAPAEHNHPYLPLAGGTLTGTLGKSNNYIFKPNGGDFRTTNSIYTGAICISLPINIGNTMLSMWIDVYNYKTNTSFSVHVGGYTYNNSTFAINPFAMVYGAQYKVRLTYNNGFKIYIGETNTTWNYPQISIRDVVLGYNKSYSNWYNDWNISFVTSFPTINSEITRYAITTDNIGNQSVNHATYTSNVGTSGTAGTNYITSANVISMYRWYNNITATDEASNTAIDKWNEIVSFLSGISDTSTLSGILAGYSPSGHNHDGRYLRLYTNSTDISNTDTLGGIYLYCVANSGGWANTSTKPTGVDNAAALLQINTHKGNYNSQLLIDGTHGQLWMRNAYNTNTWGTWKRFAYAGESYTKDESDSRYSSSTHSHPYLRLIGDTMTGVITLTSGIGAAYEKTALSFIKKSDGLEQARIGTNSGNGLGLYAKDKIYIRPNVTLGSGSTNGLVISNNLFTYNGTAVSLAGHTHSKSDITDFDHNHDNRYYTETEVNNLLANKSNTDHTHDNYLPSYNMMNSAYAYIPTYDGETGWHRIATIVGSRGYGSYILYLCGNWHYASNTNAIIHIDTMHTTAQLTQVSGIVGYINKIRLVNVDGNKYYVDVHINYTGANSPGNVYCYFLGNGSIETRTSAEKITTAITASAELTLVNGGCAHFSEQASQVPWAGITNKPSTFTPESHSHNILETYFKFVKSDVTEDAVNLSTSATAHTMTFYRNGISIPYQMDNVNDGGLLRVRGTTENNVIYEMATWDDKGAGETIQFNYYPTTSAATPTHSVSVPKKSGTIALISDIPTSLPANGGNADTVDNQHANRFPWIYNSANISASNSVTCNDIAADANSNAHMGMIYASTNNPTGASKWVHVWSQTWNRGTISSWVSQIALGVQDGTGMWYRTTAGNLASKNWTRVIDSANIYNYALSYNGTWSSGSGQNVDDANGMTFVYKNHGAPDGWGILCTFDRQYNSSYKFQLFAEGYNANGMYYRCKSADRGGWTSWKTVLDSGNVSQFALPYIEKTVAQNANTLLQNGIYNVKASITGAPVTNWGSLLSINNGYYAMQTYWPDNGLDMYIRRVGLQDSNKTTNWARILSNINYNSILPVKLVNGLSYWDMISKGYLRNDYVDAKYPVEDYLKALCLQLINSHKGYACVGSIRPSTAGSYICYVYDCQIITSTGLPEYMVGTAFLFGGGQVSFGTSGGVWYYRATLNSSNYLNYTLPRLESMQFTKTDHGYVNATLIDQNVRKLAQDSGYIEFWDTAVSSNTQGWFNSKWGKVTAVNGFEGNLTGNATSASKWATPRTITLTGSVTGSASIDGSTAVSLETTTNKLNITGFSNYGLSYYQTNSSFDGSSEGWAHYIISNHGDGASYYHYTIRLPFWGIPQYKRQCGSTSNVTEWFNFITSENISSQSVSHATTTQRFKLIIQSSGDLNTALKGGGIARNYNTHMSSGFTNAPSGSQYGSVVEFNTDNGSGQTLSMQLAWDVNHNSTTDATRYLWWRTADTNGFTNSKWHRVADFDKMLVVNKGISLTDSSNGYGAMTPDRIFAQTGEYSLTKTAFSYAYNGYVTATKPDGTTTMANLDLAGASILTFGASGAYTQLFITAPTQSGHSGITNEMLFYQNHGSGYSPGWTRVLTNRNYNSYALPLSGGTMTGSPYIKFPSSANNTVLDNNTPTGLTYGRLQSYGTMTICGDTDGSTTEYVNITAGYNITNATAANGLSIGYNTLKWKGNTIWHAGNDGANSGLDADTVDGKHASDFAVPVGTIIMWAGSKTPSGWLLCDGSVVSRTAYGALFKAIGTTYGSGNGSTTFGIPNLKGRFPLGANYQGTIGLGNNRVAYSTTLGMIGGEDKHTLNIDEMPSHNHSATTSLNKTIGNYKGDDTMPHSYNDAAGDSKSILKATTTIGYKGDSKSHNNIPPYLTVNFIIKY